MQPHSSGNTGHSRMPTVYYLCHNQLIITFKPCISLVWNLHLCAHSNDMQLQLVLNVASPERTR